MNFNLLKRKNLIIIVILACVFLIKIFLVTKLNGLGWEADEYMHFLEAKTLYTNFPANLSIGVGVWSKPGYIYFYGLIISIFNISSLVQAQIITIVLTLITSWLILKILDELKCSFKVQVLGLMLTNFSFLMFRGSLSIMTESIFALFLTAAIYFFVKKKMNLSALMFGLLPLVRIEGLFFVLGGIIISLIYQIRNSKFKIQNFLDFFIRALNLIIPTLVWDFFGFIMTGRIFYIIDSGYPLGAGKYGHGGYPYYIEGFLKIDPIIFILFAISAVYIFKYFKEKSWVKVGITSSFVIFFFLQIIFWKFGLFGTAGLMRYFVTVLPLAIISIGLFFDNFFKSTKDKLENYLIVFVVCGLQIFFTCLLFIRGGVVFNQQTKAVIEPGIEQAGMWLSKYVDANTKVYADIPEVLYFAHRDLNNSTIFGGTEAYQKDEKAVYVFKKSIERKDEFFDYLKGDVWSFSDNVYIVLH